MKVYVVDVYEKYRKQGNEKIVIWVGGRPWCIREVEMDWGVPKIQDKIEYDVNPAVYHVYEDYDEAVEYLHSMQSLNGGMN